MKKPFGYGAVLLIITIVFAASSCQTTQQRTMVATEPTVRVEKEGVTITLRHLDDQVLKEDFGTGANPFLTEYHRLSFRRIVVFELTMRNRGSVPAELVLDRCALKFAGSVREAIKAFRLLEYWEFLDEDRRVTRKKEQIIDRFVLPNRAVVGSGSTLFGYLVFMGNVPRTGEATVYVPVFREGGSLGFQVDYTF